MTTRFLMVRSVLLNSLDCFIFNFQKIAEGAFTRPKLRKSLSPRLQFCSAMT